MLSKVFITTSVVINSQKNYYALKLYCPMLVDYSHDSGYNILKHKTIELSKKIYLTKI